MVLSLKILASLFFILSFANLQGATLSLKPGADLFRESSLAKAGTTIKLAPGLYNGPIQVIGKKLKVIGAPMGTSIVTAPKGPAVVVAANGGSLQIESLTIDTQNKVKMAAYVKSGSLSLKDVYIDGVIDNAVYCDGGDLTVSACSFANIGKAGVFATGNAKLTVLDSFFEEMNSIGVAAQHASNTVIKRCSFTNLPRPVFVLLKSGNVTIQDNVVESAPGNFNAISVTTTGNCSILGNSIHSPFVGISCEGTASTTWKIAHNVITDARQVGIFATVTNGASTAPAAEFFKNTILRSSKFGTIFNGPDTVVLKGNTIIPAADGTGISIQKNASAQIIENSILTKGTAVNFHTVKAENVTLAGNFLKGSIVPKSFSTPTAADRRVSAVLKAPSLSTELQKHWEAAGSLNGGSSLVASGKLLGLIRRIQEQSNELSELGLHVMDSAGQAYTPSFNVLSIDGTLIGKGSQSAPAVFVTSGEYDVEYEKDAFYGRTVKVSERTSTITTIPVPNSLWFSIGNDRVLLKLQDDETRKTMAKKWRPMPTGYSKSWAVPRTNVTTADITTAVTQAKSHLAHGKTPLSWTERFSYEAALRILSIFGDKDDCQLIANTIANRTTIAEKSENMAFLARLEARLGLLHTGQTAKLLASKDQLTSILAAIHLQSYGLASGKEVLISSLEKPLEKLPTSDMVAALQHHFDPRIITAIQNLAKSGRFPGKMGLRYLLTYGQQKDLHWVGKTRFNWFEAISALPYGKNQIELMFAIAKAGKVQGTVHMLPVLTLLGKDTATFLSGILPSLAAMNRGIETRPRTRFDIDTSWFSPNERTASYFFKNRLFVGQPWIKEPSVLPKVTKALKKATYANTIMLDPLSNDEVKKALAGIKETEMLIAHHKVLTRFHRRWESGIRREFERRSYCLANRAKEGAISGSVTVTPQLDDGRFSATLHFANEGYYHVSSLIDFNEGVRERWEHHKYVANGGRELLARAQLKRGTEVFDVSISGPDDTGNILLTCDIDEKSFNELSLVLSLKFFDEELPLIFDIYESQWAFNKRSTLNMKGDD
jgi:hypothetical protein